MSGERGVLKLLEAERKRNLRARLKQEALTNAERDLAMAAEWVPLEEEASRTFEASSKPST